MFRSILKNVATIIAPPQLASATAPFSTTSVLSYKTLKRRKTYPFFWLQDKYRTFYDENLSPENEQFVQQFIKSKYALPSGTSPLKKEPWDVKEEYTPETQRTGVIGRKLGQTHQWTKNGRKIKCTVLQVTDNHVIKYHPPEEFARIGRPVDRKRYAGLGCMIVGADSRDPRQFTAEYNGLFRESGVMPKKKLTRFFITHDARIEPGTPLVVSHFRPGMYCDVYGKSTFWGIKGLRFTHRGLKLGCKTHGNTKNHNRIGSIGRGRKYAGPKKGKRMVRPKGNERVVMPGLKIWRINTKYNLIYLSGPGVPGPLGAYVNIMDSRLHEKRPSSLNLTPPFPTASLEAHAGLDEELHDKDLHRSSDPSIVFEITEQERKAAEEAARRFGKKAKTAQKY